MRCTAKKTAALITESGNDYVIGVKGNHKNLHQEAIAIMSHREKIDSSYSQMEVNRGRVEVRTTQVSDQVHLVSGE
jgi:hypothetical protein